MEPSITPTNTRQLFLFRAGILGSALLIGTGIFMYAGQSVSPRDVRGDIMSPDHLTEADMNAMLTTNNPYISETGVETLGTTNDTMNFDQDAFLAELLQDPATTSTGEVMEYATDYMEEATVDDEIQAKIAYQEQQKQQIRAQVAQYWTEQDALTAPLRGVAPAFDDGFGNVDPTAMGGGASDLSITGNTTPSEMPKSGPGILLAGLASLGAAAILRRK